MSAMIAPELPLLVEQLPRGAGWLYELKLNGFRLICMHKGGTASLFTRRGNDWTRRFPTIARSVTELSPENVILNGAASS